jgi:hypothetical protein
MKLYWSSDLFEYECDEAGKVMNTRWKLFWLCKVTTRYTHDQLLFGDKTSR